jgi:hypothetical protein
MDKAEVRRILEELAQVSKDLEANARMLSKAANIIAAEQLRKRVNELTARQNTMMTQLVGMHPEAAVRDRYHQLSRQVDELQKEVKGTSDMDELKRLDGEITSRVGDYVHHFQTIVANLMGAPPPPEPIYE